MGRYRLLSVLGDRTRDNLIRYKCIPPPWALIEETVQKSGLKVYRRFEFVWAIPERTLTLYKNGFQKLPPKYWHIFYDYEEASQIYATSDKKDTFAPTQTPKALDRNKSIINGYSKQRG